MKFTKWISWNERNNLPDIEYPGVYAIAILKREISNEKYSIIKEISYYGMTNSIGGLKNRLKQFDNTIKGKDGHGGAKRVRYKFEDYKKLIKHLYVAVRPFKCDVNSNTVKDLLIMGEVEEYEYICFAEYVKKFGMLPEFNNKKLSPKK